MKICNAPLAPTQCASLIAASGLCLVASTAKGVANARPASLRRTSLPLPALCALGALDFAANALTHHVTSSSIKSGTGVVFPGHVAMHGDERPTVAVFDNASSHHAIGPDVHDSWRRKHRMQPFCLSPYSRELNLIEIACKQATYHCRNVVSTTKQTIADEVDNLWLLPHQISSQFHLKT